MMRATAVLALVLSHVVVGADEEVKISEISLERMEKMVRRMGTMLAHPIHPTVRARHFV